MAEEFHERRIADAAAEHLGSEGVSKHVGDNASGTSVHGSAIKRINGWREGPRLVSPPSSIRRLAFTLLHGPVSNEKRMSASWTPRHRVHSCHWPVLND